jgi:hypothetical protein
MKLIFIKNIKNLLLIYLTIFLLSFSLVIAQDNADFLNMASQGKIRTCLTATADNVDQNGWKNVNGTIKLKGQCLSQSGCEIWQCNSDNKEIAEDEALVQKCKTNSQSAGCSNPEKIKELEAKIAKSVQVQPGCHKDEVFVPYGTVNTSITGEFIPHVDYNFYAIGKANPVTKDTGKGGIEANDNSQKLSAVKFSFENTKGSQQDCVAISWDPYGRVFDAVSLEPISDVRVTLIDADSEKPAVQQFESNFDITDLKGLYNILVEKEGRYRLDVDAPSSHIFSSNFNLNPKYSEIYSDIYLGGVYQEKTGVPTHHDIPLVPKGSPYTGAVAEVVEGSLNQTDMGTFVNYSGQVTFPKAKVCLIDSQKNQVVGECVSADKYGKFEISVDKKNIPNNFLNIQVSKVSLIDTNNAQQQTNINSEVGFQPILNYVEGYVYDEKNNIAPLTKVVVKLKMNNKIFSQTTADKNGFIKIESDKLPFFEYYFEFINPITGEKITSSTSEFVSKNKIYLDSGKINLMKATKEDQPIINPTTGELNNIISRPKKNNQTSPLTKNTFNPVILVTSLILILLVITTSAIFIYIKKRQYLIGS